MRVLDDTLTKAIREHLFSRLDSYLEQADCLKKHYLGSGSWKLYWYKGVYSNEDVLSISLSGEFENPGSFFVTPRVYYQSLNLQDVITLFKDREEFQDYCLNHLEQLMIQTHGIQTKYTQGELNEQANQGANQHL